MSVTSLPAPAQRGDPEMPRGLGACDECGRPAERFPSVGGLHFGACEHCRVVWPVGENLFDWRYDWSIPELQVFANFDVSAFKDDDHWGEEIYMMESAALEAGSRLEGGHYPPGRAAHLLKLTHRLERKLKLMKKVARLRGYAPPPPQLCPQCRLGFLDPGEVPPCSFCLAAAGKREIHIYKDEGIVLVRFLGPEPDGETTRAPE